MLISQTPIPPRGWNSYDSYGVYINEEQALANLEAFIEKLQPAGYEYFVLDACWYADGDFMDNYRALKEGRERFMYIDEWGRFIGSPRTFPRGLRYLSDRCHEAGVRFGLHLMRGLPARALELNPPVKGHPSARARDIADPENSCVWCAYTKGIRMDAPGAQEYYDSVAEYFAEDLCLDFVKFDDAVDYPREIEAFAQALDKVDRPILLSLSPGQEAFPGNWDLYARFGNMLRITGDVWDRDHYNDMKFDRWALFENFGGPECWLDLDMIPLGGIQAHVPEGTAPEYQPVLGCRRRSDMSETGKKVMMTQLALAASPLIYGGDLPMSTEEDIAWVTDPDMLECNANGVVGKRIFHQRHLDVRRAEKKGSGGRHGWIGIFNREDSRSLRHCSVTPEELGFAGSFPERLYDVWCKQVVRPDSSGILSFPLKAKDVLFLSY